MPSAPADLAAALTACPLIAILRGLEPGRAEGIGAALVEAGFRIIEVPLNSPDPFRSIEILSRRFGEAALIGAGTVLDPDDVDRLAAAGGRLVVMPHSDPAVIARAKARGLAAAPGVATPTEAFAALRNGADILKMFPAEGLPPAVLKAWLAVLPKGTALVPVGGLTPDNLAPYWSAGAAGFGLGSALFTPQLSTPEIAARAARFIEAVAGLPAKAA